MPETETHSYRKEHIDNRLKQAQDASETTKENLTLIADFIKNCYAEGLSYSRIYKYLIQLLNICKTLRALGINKTLSELEKDELKTYCAWLEQQDRYTPNTKLNYKVTLKKLFKVLNGGEDYPDKIRFIKLSLKAKDNKLPNDMLSESDMDSMIKTAIHPRNKALISLMCESGGRLGEIHALSLKDIEFDSNGAKVRLSGKTGTRIIRVVRCVPHLAAWINMHPAQKGGDSPLWIKNTGKKLNYASIPKILREHGKKAGIHKKVHPHILRHSRATLWARRLTEAQMKAFFGWTQSSKMCATYIHLSARDNDESILGLYGVAKAKIDAPPLPVKCPRCAVALEHDAKFCYACGLPQGIEHALEQDNAIKQTGNILSQLLANPETRSGLEKLFERIILKNSNQ